MSESRSRDRWDGLPGLGRPGARAFDPADAQECDLRLLVPNLGDMRVRHVAYMGERDEREFVRRARLAARQAGAPLTVNVVAGDHVTSLPLAIQDFLQEVSALR